MLWIKPKNEADEHEEKKKNNLEVLKQIGKKLQLKPTPSYKARRIPYYYSYGTLATSTTIASNRSVTTTMTTSFSQVMNHQPAHFNRSVSDGCVIAPNNRSLPDFDLSKLAISQKPTPTNRIMDQSITSIATTNTLYNIDEDKEVENSFKPTENTTNVVSNKSSTSNLDNSSDSDTDESFGPPKVKCLIHLIHGTLTNKILKLNFLMDNQIIS